MNTSIHRAGFAHIVGKPNVGKSTLFNALVQYPLSIISPKAQTTRQNIIGIAQGKDYQVVYVDTPGYLEPTYLLQQIMQRSVYRALQDSDVLVWMVDVQETTIDPLLSTQVQKQALPLFLVVNKVDSIGAALLATCLAQWRAVEATRIIPMSAHNKEDVAELAKEITKQLPLHPPYYDRDTLTDRSERFFAAEMIRKAIFLHYRQEIPYSTQVVIEQFKEKEENIAIDAVIYVERTQQKPIIIGKGGKALKWVGTYARKEMEAFFQKKVFLTQHVKIAPDWRTNKKILTEWGYC